MGVGGDQTQSGSDWVLIVLEEIKLDQVVWVLMVLDEIKLDLVIWVLMVLEEIELDLVIKLNLAVIEWW